MARRDSPPCLAMNGPGPSREVSRWQFFLMVVAPILLSLRRHHHSQPLRWQRRLELQQSAITAMVIAVARLMVEEVSLRPRRSGPCQPT